MALAHVPGIEEDTHLGVDRPAECAQITLEVVQRIEREFWACWLSIGALSLAERILACAYWSADAIGRTMSKKKPSQGSIAIYLGHMRLDELLDIWRVDIQFAVEAGLEGWRAHDAPGFIAAQPFG